MLGYNTPTYWAIRMKPNHALPYFSANNTIWATKVAYSDGSWGYKTLDYCILADPRNVAGARPITIDHAGNVTYLEV